MRPNWHAGQKAALRSEKRIVAVIAGGRSGKTSIGPAWLWREMRRQGPGDYLVAAPTHPLLDYAAAPEVESFFGSLMGLGSLIRSPLQFRFSAEGCLRMWGSIPDRTPRIIFSHATNPSALEAMSAKAAWLDEAGLPGFRLASFQAVQQRLAVDQGRCLITTKPYTLGWLKGLFDEWQEARRGGGSHPRLDVIKFGMGMNPAISPKEIAELRATLPTWKAAIDIDGEFSRPAGRIYDCWDAARHVVPDYPIPHTWKRYGGLDFGGVNTAGVVAVQHPATGEYVIVREYHQGSLTSAGHARALEKLAECGIRPELGEIPPRCQWWTGGAGSEDQWRREFAQAGMPVAAPPIREVDVGIARVYSMLATGRLRVFRSCEHTIDQLSSYSYVVGDDGEVKEPKEIEAKASYHVADAVRYLACRLEGEARKPKGLPGVIERGRR